MYCNQKQLVMNEHFYFSLYIGGFVANTYAGTRSNARAYFKRWIEKEISFPDDYDFFICRFETLEDMLHYSNCLSRVEFTV